MSTVASESCFNEKKKVFDDKMNRMNQRTLQMCICLKYWFDAEDRLQNQEGHDTCSDTGEGATPSDRSTQFDEEID